MIQTITIMTDPKGKGRPRFTRTGHAYTPKETRDYEKLISIAYKRQKGIMFDGAVFVRLKFCKAIPKSWPATMKREALEGKLDCTCKPDIDNQVKACFDALNGVAWADDKQVIGLTATKQYAENSCVTIEIESGDQVESCC